MASDLQFKSDSSLSPVGAADGACWKIIISDDDTDVHEVTRLALDGFLFEDRPLCFLSAYNGAETIQLVGENPDTAVLLLDVVMEEEDSGLKVVEHIRKQLNNPFIRIILRTGQPGQAPQMQVIRDFDINDYKEKLELSDQKLSATVVASIRAYRDMRLIEQHRHVIEESLREKEVLIKEIHHRVKNNLQVITSLLNMQAMRIEDLQSLKMFQDSRDRVRTMAMIHEKLYQSDKFSKIDFGDYLSCLAEELTALYSSTRRITFDMSLEPVEIGINHAVPCGLIANELISNALKHAFPGRSTGTIRISLKRTGGLVSFLVADDGAGLSEAIDLAQAETLGLQLVYVLGEQLEADLLIERNPGTLFRLTFEDPEE